jgi:hypothetical protein
MSRFVKPETTTLKISRGDTLTVKRRLNSGEQRAAFARMAVAGVDGQRRIDSTEVGRSLMVAYLVDWSLTDDDGKRVEIADLPPDAVASVLDALDPESFVEIREAIEAHDASIRAEREQEKNGQGGGKESSAISPSPEPLAGATSGSVN